jgi:hypothetical protein
MKVLTIKQARFIALFDVDELMPLGLTPMSKIVPTIASRFEFQGFTTPNNGQDKDSSKGFEFSDGIWDGTPVPRLAIFNDGIIVETRISTSRSREIFTESMDWAKRELGLKVGEDILRRLRFLSILTLQSKAPLLNPSVAISNAADRMAAAMEAITGREREYSGIRIDIDFDRSADKESIAGLTIQTLALEPFQSNRYFSQAPLPTDEHIALLEQYETDVLAARS